MYFHREKENIMFLLGRNLKKNICTVTKTTFVLKFSNTQSTRKVTVSILVCIYLWCHKIIILKILLMCYLNPTTPSISEAKPASLRTAPCYRTTAADGMATGWLQITFSCAYILNASYHSSLINKGEKKKCNEIIQP